MPMNWTIQCGVLVDADVLDNTEWVLVDADVLDNAVCVLVDADVLDSVAF